MSSLPSSGLSTGAIAGVALVGGSLLFAVIAISILVRGRKKKAAEEEAARGETAAQQRDTTWTDWFSRMWNGGN